MATENTTTSGHSKGPSESSAKSSSSRCTQCTRPDVNNAKNRNIVVCIDGTSNRFGEKNTNVVKLFAQINLETTEPKQYAYYTSGIGTSPKSLNVFSRMERAISDRVGMAVAWNMEEIVKDAYGWLARTYEEGDQIYLFGFSRGAYQVRVLAGMIYEVGLIRTPTEKQIRTAYDHYEAIRAHKPKTKQIAREFKNTFSWKGLGVHFVGVWDTVSSVGLIRGDVFLSTSSSAAHACHFRHALALDELRVKFMPEYFHEMNSQISDPTSKDSFTRRQESTATGYDVDHPEGNGHAAEMETRNPSDVTTADNVSERSERKGHTTEIKEVWFAGSHSDVGGRNRPGCPYQPGNVSLLWMRREAAASGLVLFPTDIVWIPDDLDFGTKNSMTFPWRVVECVPIKHQTSFSGAGDDTRRPHFFQPRRIIPGQKIHASVLYCNAYTPRATLGEGFDIPVVHAEPEDTDQDHRLWETDLFDATAAETLLTSLGSQQAIAPIHLDRLLFMLRFKEGKECVKKVNNWRSQIEELVKKNTGKTSLINLVALVAYYEATYDTTSSASPASHSEGPAFTDEVFDRAEKCLMNILDQHPNPDVPRVVALLRPLTKHEILRRRILMPRALGKLAMLLDDMLGSEAHFGQVMDGLNCLLHCEQTRLLLYKRLEERDSRNMCRLSRILRIDKSHLLAAALRMVLTLARIPEVTPAVMTEREKRAADHAARANDAERAEAEKALAEAKAQKQLNAEFWLPIKDRLLQLATKNDRLVGRLAVQILLALYEESDSSRLEKNLRKSRVRSNVAGALISLKPQNEGGDTDPEYQMLHHVFGFGKPELTDPQKQRLKKLQLVMTIGNAAERTAGTLTFLKLCETESIRTQVRENGLLDIFINQLRSKNSALLAAYALVTCLKKYDDMKMFIKGPDSLLPKHIVGMLRMDYFDDAVGSVEGFEIFRDFMQDEDLRKKINKYKITEILNEKLSKGNPKETRTSLICLDIFLSFDPEGPWVGKLVKRSLEYLKDPVWNTQKAGVLILSSLAQTEKGANTIRESITEIIGILLKDHREQNERTSGNSASTNGSLPIGSQASQNHQLSNEEGASASPVPQNDDRQPRKVETQSASVPQVERLPRKPPPAVTLPDDHMPTQELASASSALPDTRRTPSEPILSTSAPPDDGQTQLDGSTVQSRNSEATNRTPKSLSSEPSSWMMGPICALRVLAQKEELRKYMGRTQEYSTLKSLHSTRLLVSEADTSPWRIKTPNRNDVTNMLDKMIRAVDGEMSEENLTSIGDAVLPRIKHWDRLVTLLVDRAVGGTTALFALLAISPLLALTAVVAPPIFLSRRLIGLIDELRSRSQNDRILDTLLEDDEDHSSEPHQISSRSAETAPA